MDVKDKEVKQILETLSPIERKILPYLREKFKIIREKSALDSTSVLRALGFLKSKGIVELIEKKTKIIDLDVNGILYSRKGLPERRLLHLIAEKKTIKLQDAQKQSKLSDNEFKGALGALKAKALINLSKGNILLNAKQEEIRKHSLEEQFLLKLPIEQQNLKAEEKLAFENLKKRKKIVMLNDKKEIKIKVTELGERILGEDIEKLEKQGMIEALSPEMIKKSSWKGKKFRRYDINSQVPRLFGGKRHPVNREIERAKKIWLELGFQEMQGNLVQESFWVFDALFTAQDHPVRDIQDTFFINKQGELPEKKIVQAVKEAHETGVSGSKGWQYNWQEPEARKFVLRTHTTCLSAQTLAKLRDLKSKDKKNKKGKFFALGKCFRNETIDAGHLFEFNQTEGIVVDKDANFQHLLGYLKSFLNKMGFEKIRFRPHFFPYTEPSVEADVYDEKSGKWIEILGAGIFRPEVTIPLIGEWVPVLAWGFGFDRLVMQNYGIKDIRELYGNNIDKLREIKF